MFEGIRIFRTFYLKKNGAAISVSTCWCAFWKKDDPRSQDGISFLYSSQGVLFFMACIGSCSWSSGPRRDLELSSFLSFSFLYFSWLCHNKTSWIAHAGSCPGPIPNLQDMSFRNHLRSELWYGKPVGEPQEIYPKSKMASSKTHKNERFMGKP